MATDGATASRAAAKALGVRDMALHKKRGLAIEEMVIPELAINPAPLI